MNCYNGARYLREAIDSIYLQTYKNWEIIFWDNASNDKSPEIAKSYDSKLHYYKSDGKILLGAARNNALKKCRGQYITFLDVDDLWMPRKLELQMQKIHEYPDSIVCYSDGYEMYNDLKSNNKFSSNKNVKYFQGNIFDKLILSNFINWQTVLINKNLAGDKLIFNENLTFAEDHEILLKLSLVGRITFLDEPLIYYRLHQNNMSHDYELILKESNQILELFKNEIFTRKIKINKAKGLIYGSVVIKLIRGNGDYRKFIKYLIRYSNLQNIIVYILIKLNLTVLLTINKKNKY